MKRSFDVLAALLALALLSPLLLAIWLSIRMTLGGPALFRQLRPGKNGTLFEMVKFRSMRQDRGADGAPLPDAQRMTRLGARLRATSLDELPELWNVLRGDMSLVGPRPLLPDYLPLYSERQRRRHDVRPGITGWAQVNGRNALPWQQRLELDVWYVENRSFALDMRILWRTFSKVLHREGISAPGSATMEPFRGNPDGNAPTSFHESRPATHKESP
ncbi:exopolysaccharide biosynthesis glycosyl transferase [Bordetella ansorpii]|uniref:Exopolysaccharide biosynthesis glycosyl transferase n=1 Tax=Bordetella ansorpii TaxID=288768 RepID=A0A146AWZ9_9BORD|nr:sugar transferase [Bordetella ansorpii]CZZ93600.1 exopolysaccharide biosynthesis glycosyl transferase [Bordetella ansorpii]